MLIGLAAALLILFNGRIAGFCPGPALVPLLAGQPQAWMFVGAMLAGMALFEVLARRKLPAPA